MRWAGLVTLALLLLSILMVLPWRWLAPPTSAIMLLHQRATDRDVHHFWVPWEQIAPWLPRNAQNTWLSTALQIGLR